MSAWRRPNVVMAVFDALGTNALDRHLSDLPALHNLQSNSITFQNAYTPNPEGSPARASLFTGLDPCAHGVWTDGVALPAHETTFPQRLYQGGYQTWLVGRRQLSGAAQWTTEPLRADEYTICEWAHGPLHRSRQNAYLAWLQKRAPDTFAHIFPRQANPDNTDISSEQLQAMQGLEFRFSFNSWIGQRIGQLITDHTSDQPFLAVASFVVGESMGGQPAACGDKLNTQSLTFADFALKNILQCLEATGHNDNTVVVICSVSGNRDDEHPTVQLNENRIKVPIIINIPRGESGVIDQPVSTIDLMPTILDVTRLPLPHRIQGSSLLANSPPRNWSLSRLRSEEQGFHSALCTNDWKLCVSHGCTSSNATPTYQLYNLTSDPREHHDLSPDSAHAHRLEAMVDQMIDARCAMEDRTEPRIAKF